MAKEAPLYDLMLLLSTSAEDGQRAKILADVEAAIARAGGSVERNDDWGQRPMAYEIRHQPEAEYHLLQFKAPPTLIEDLSHTLRITDGVVRFRVIKVRPGTPPAPSSPPPVVASVAAGHTGGASTRSAERESEPSSRSAERESEPREADEAEPAEPAAAAEPAETPAPAEPAEAPPAVVAAEDSGDEASAES